MLCYRTCVVLLAASTLAGLLTAPSGPRASPGDPDAPQPARTPAPLVERTVSELVLIETYVDDSRGRPLAGLTADDFVLMVDGRKSPISSFEYRRIGVPAAGTADQTTAPGRAVGVAGLPRRFMLFFEDGASAPAGLTAARRAAQRFLATGLDPSDQVGVAAYDMDLRILRDFTTDREALRRVIDQSLHEARRISDFAAEQQEHDEEIGRLLSEIKQMNDVLGKGGRVQNSATLKAFQDRTRSGDALTPAAAELAKQARALARVYGLEEAPRLRGVLRALRTLTDSIAAWGGYKAIVYMGDGLSENPALPYVERVLAVLGDDGLSSQVTQSSLVSDLQDLLQAAAAAGITIHTLQTRGLETGTGREMQAARRRSNSLESIALGTGGLASSSNDFLKALNDFETDSRGYYILGYLPQGPPDGRFHSVQVQCRKRGARVRWRKGFVRLDPKQAHERAILAAYTVPEMYPQMEIGLSAVTGPASPAGRVMDLVVHVPGDRILFRPEGGRPTAHLEVGLVAVDEARKETVRTSRGLSIALHPDHERPGEVGVNLVRRVRLPAGRQSITAVVYDDAAGLVGGTRLSLAPDATGTGQVLGLSIYSLRDRSIWIEVPEGPVHGVSDPSTEYTIGPALKAGYAPGEPLVCGFRMPEGTGGVASLRVVIRQGDNLLQTVAVEAPDIVAGGKVHVPLPSDHLLPGEYTVAVQEILPAGPVDRGAAALSIRPGDASTAARPGSPEP